MSFVLIPRNNECKKPSFFKRYVLESFLEKKKIAAEMWKQIVNMGYCDVNTTRESIECQTKYHRTQTNVSKRMCQRSSSCPRKKKISWVVTYLPCVAGVKVWNAWSGFRLCLLSTGSWNASPPRTRSWDPSWHALWIAITFCGRFSSDWLFTFVIHWHRESHR